MTHAAAITTNALVEEGSLGVALTEQPTLFADANAACLHIERTPLRLVQWGHG